MSSAARPPAAVRWLTPAEMEAWLALVGLVTLLPQALDRQLRQDAGVNHVQYQILARLSAAPHGELAMGELARTTALSPSRLSHAVSSLEARGWVRRRAANADGRVQVASLTGDGRRFLEHAAPGHVDTVRRLVFDDLDDERVAALADIAGTILSALQR